MAQEVTQPAEPIRVEVGWPVDVPRAADLGRSFAASLGFPPAECDEISLVVSELASNLIRHASHGLIKMSPLGARPRAGIRVESEDGGPGMADVEKAMTDGYSTGGGLGLGLGTINRLMDELEVYSGQHSGLHIVCDKWVRPKAVAALQRDLIFGAATRSCRLAPENGDAFVIKRWERNTLAGVIDGLGHGQFAQRAAQTARQYIERHFDQPIDSLFRGAGRACRATRGVVMALARFDMAERKLTLASVGNIEVRLIGSVEPFNPVVRRGVIGLNAPNPFCTEHAWGPANLLIMHSDGLRTHWNWNEFRDLTLAAPDAIAQRLLRTLGKIEDDATVLVARSADR